MTTRTPEGRGEADLRGDAAEGTVNPWPSLSEAALCRGVCSTTIHDAAVDGRIRWRWGHSLTRPKQTRIEVYWPDLERCVFPGKGKGGGGTGTSSGPVTDETWARFCEVFDRLAQQMQEEGRA